MNEKTNSIPLGPSTRACPVETVGEWGAEWLRRRAAEGSRSTPTETSRWKYVNASWLGRMALVAVTMQDARAWFDEFMLADLSTHTKRDVLNQVRQTFEGACELGRIPYNPFDSIRLPRWKPNMRVHVKEPWTVLTLPEQANLLRAIHDESGRRLVTFAMGTGLRQGEQWSMRREHVVLIDEPYVAVVFGGTDDRPTKSGTPRRVPLFGAALHAVREQLRVTHTEYVWPAPRGGPRDKKPPRQWRAWLNAAGIERSVRWHDLRHTCAASLVSGWWGRAWSLEEVRQLLGHSSITITERYAHFAKNMLAKAAFEAQIAQRRKYAHEG